MIEKLKPRSKFNRNVLTLMTGTTIAQSIPIAISPILTRLYTPEDFGLYAFFMAIVAVLGSIASGRYELAIMLPDKDEDAINIFAVGLIITSFLSIFSLLIVIVFNNQITILLHKQEISNWLYFIPVVVFFTGLFNLLTYFSNRKKLYKEIANAIILKSIALTFIQLAVGLFKSGVTGLISGLIISSAFANMRLLKNIVTNKELLTHITKIKMIALSKRYQNFPKFSMPAVLANSLSQHLTNILISAFYSVATLGFYSLVQRVLGMPSTLIGNSIGQVFLEQATKEKQQAGKAIKTFNHTVEKLLLIGIPSFGVLFFLVEELFAIIFGEEWRVAGQYAQIIIPLFFIRFVSSTVSGIMTVFEKQKHELIINLCLMLTSMISIFIFHDFVLFLYFFTITMSLNYLIFLAYYYKLSKGM